jgi:acyl transferase domain-containing protein
MSLSKDEKMRASYGSFVTDMESFDTVLFRISLAKAKAMDLKQQILLGCEYLALKDTGYTMDRLRGAKCGVLWMLF